MSAECERGFDTAEYEARTARAQALMAQAGIAALWFTTEPEIRYFTGFLTQFWQSPARPWFMLVPASGKPVAVIPAIGEPLVKRGWLDDIRTWPSPSPQDEGVSLLAATITELAGTGDIGMPMGPETSFRMPLNDFDRLQRQLPNRFVDGSEIVRDLRMIKSPAEVAKIAYACLLAGRAFAAMPTTLRAGMPLVGAFRQFRRACLEAGLDDIPYLAGAAGPLGYADVISPPTTAPLTDGDVLMLDTGAVFDGYFCDFDRNFAVGRTNSTVIAAYARLADATAAGLEAARPGLTGAELYAVMNKHLGAGDNNVGRLGHGLGMQLTEWPSLAAWDQTVLKPGMVITLEPATPTSAGKMLVQEEDIVITETGCQLLTQRTAVDLPVIS